MALLAEGCVLRLVTGTKRKKMKICGVEGLAVAVSLYRQSLLGQRLGFLWQVAGQVEIRLLRIVGRWRLIRTGDGKSELPLLRNLDY